MKQPLLIATAIAALCLGAVSQAQTVAPPTDPQRSTDPQSRQATPTTGQSGMRTDKTGQNGMGGMDGKQQFTTLDTNADGSLSRTELASMQGAMGSDGFAGVDTDGNGSVSSTEFTRFHGTRSRASGTHGDSGQDMSHDGDEER